MKRTPFAQVLSLIGALLLASSYFHSGRGQEPRPSASIDGAGPDWRALGESDFTNVNCYTDTWTWKNGLLTCSGQPIGDRKSTRLNSSHLGTSYAVFCLKK